MSKLSFSANIDISGYSSGAKISNEGTNSKHSGSLAGPRFVNEMSSGHRRLLQVSRPRKQTSLLAGIAARAAAKAQVDILDWVFSEGFQVSLDSLNDEFYHGACLV